MVEKEEEEEEEKEEEEVEATVLLDTTGENRASKGFFWLEKFKEVKSEPGSVRKCNLET